jgi:hypothetical protein
MHLASPRQASTCHTERRRIKREERQVVNLGELAEEGAGELQQRDHERVFQYSFFDSCETQTYIACKNIVLECHLNILEMKVLDTYS